MKIEFLKRYGLSEIGDVLENVNKPIAESLIFRKIAKLVLPKKDKKK